MKINTTIRYHLLFIRMTIKSPHTINDGKGVEKRETSYMTGGIVNQ